MALIDSFSRFLYNCKNLFATKSEVNTISEKIPTQASAQNQLADKNFVNSSIQTATATFRGTWSTWADVPADSTSDSGYYIVDSSNNDYLVVRDASGYAPVWESANEYFEDNVVYYHDDSGMEEEREGLYKCIVASTVEAPYLLNDWVKIDKNPDYLGTWRFKYVPEGQTYNKDNWKPEYQINEEPLTAAQIAALNSNITEALVSEFGAKYTKPSSGIPKTDLASAVQTSLDLADSVTGKADKVSGASNGNFAGLDSNGNLTDSGYDATDFATPASVAAKQDTLTASTGITIDANNNISTDNNAILNSILGINITSTYDGVTVTKTLQGWIDTINAVTKTTTITEEEQ